MNIHAICRVTRVNGTGASGQPASDAINAFIAQCSDRRLRRLMRDLARKGELSCIEIGGPDGAATREVVVSRRGVQRMAKFTGKRFGHYGDCAVVYAPAGCSREDS